MRRRIAGAAWLVGAIVMVCMVGTVMADRRAATQQVAMDDYASMVPPMIAAEILPFMR